MFERKSGRTKSQAAQAARGPDRCEKCKAQHVRCDGVRPVCKRCHGRGHACIYVPKRSPWTVYTDAGKEPWAEADDALTLSHPTSATSFPEPHTESVLDASIAPGSAVLTSKSRLPTLQHVRTMVLNTYTSNQLHSSVDTVPSRWNWSDIRVDVHALMDHFFQIDARYVPSGYLNEIVSSVDLTVSYASLPALYQSILKRQYETDPAVLNVRGSVLQSINKALQKRSCQVDDSTIISIKHQLYYDCFISSKPVIIAHLNGLHQIVRIRGGLQALGLDGDLAHMLKLHTLMAYIITERPPPSDYLRYKTRCSNAIETITPANLAYCPLLLLTGGDAPITAIDDDPRGRLQRLISLLQQLTDSFLNPGPLSGERQEQLYLHVLQSPVSCLNPSDPPMAWIYESCRLAGMVFAAAIRYCVPLSSAALRAAQDSDDVSLLDNLYRAIYRSPYASRPFWGEWAGCFLWVSLVSASLSQCGVHVESPQDDLYWDAKSRRASLVVPFSFATKLFHAKMTSDQAFLITEIMIFIQGKLAAVADNVEESRKP